MKWTDMSKIPVNPLKKRNYIVTEIDKIKTLQKWPKDNEIWQRRSQTNRTEKFDIFFVFCFFLKTTKGLKWDSFWTCNADSFKPSYALDSFFWIHMTGTINIHFTVQFINYCIDLRASCEQKRPLWSCPSARDFIQGLCSQKKIQNKEKNYQSISE